MPHQSLLSTRVILIWTYNYECVFAVDTSYPIQDDFYQESKIYQEYAPQVRFTFWIAIATGFAMLVILAWLTIVAGRSNREEGIVLNRVDKMKTEIFILLSVAVMVICIYGEISLSYSLLNGDQGKDFVEEQYFMSDHQIRPDWDPASGGGLESCDFVWSTGCSSLDRDRHVGAGNLAVRNACGRGGGIFLPDAQSHRKSADHQRGKSNRRRSG